MPQHSAVPPLLRWTCKLALQLLRSEIWGQIIPSDIHPLLSAQSVMYLNNVTSAKRSFTLIHCTTRGSFFQHISEIPLQRKKKRKKTNKQRKKKNITYLQYGSSLKQEIYEQQGLKKKSYLDYHRILVQWFCKYLLFLLSLSLCFSFVFPITSALSTGATSPSR